MTARRAGLAAAVLALGAAGCDQASLDVAPPLDRVFFPTGVAVHALPDGRTALLVASSNFDLTYARERGGTLLAIDPGQGPGVETAPAGAAPAVLGGTVIDSFAGELAVADGAECGLPAPLALVPTRIGNALHAVPIAADGGLECGDGCRLDLPTEFRSAYSVAVACGTTLGPRAFVSHLEARPSADGFVHGWISEIDLAGPTSAPGPRLASTIDLGAGTSTVRTVRWDPAALRLFATPVGSTLNFSALRWLYPTARLEPQEGSTTQPVPSEAVNFNDFLRNGTPEDVAFSSDRRRVFVTVLLNDPSFLGTAGVLVPVAGALAVMEVQEGTTGALSLRLVRVVPMGAGPGPLQVIPRAGRGDLVAVADTRGDEVYLYDDDAGAVVRAFGRDALGRPVAGRQPFGLARQQVAGGGERLFVGAFGEGIVTVIDMDPDAPHAARVTKRIGVRP